ncbi:hypothetical protein BGW41_000544 [Actinomortierella wolfii]|nr:hypothetical protein BGW41_000544 [Actinomortierella wolfii]
MLSNHPQQDHEGHPSVTLPSPYSDADLQHPHSKQALPEMTFRPHHHSQNSNETSQVRDTASCNLQAPELRHMQSYSSMSSYASSEDNDEDGGHNVAGGSSEGLSQEEQPSSSSRAKTANESDSTIADPANSSSLLISTDAPTTSTPTTTTPNKTTAVSTSKRQPNTGNKRIRPGEGTPLRPAGKAHDWYSGGRITSHGRWFRDSQNRTLLLRGVNLCGNSKLPTTPNGSTHLNEGFFDHRNVSFLGRPFPRDQADEHFARLRQWGLTFVRLLAPWEALEHAGPGIYDEEFIDSLIELIELMPKYGIKCFIDPHQDCWSRFSGGSGAPGWTFEVAGLDMTKFKATGAAYVHNTNTYPGDSPPMVWPTNYTKLAASTMFTLFWAGDTFAPQATYEGEPVQQFLQRHYIACYTHLARRLSHLDAVIGFEVMNEPHPGYIGLKDLKQYEYEANLFFGDFPSALESMALGAGIPQNIGHWVKSWPYPTKKQFSRMINTEKEVAWINGECIWQKHGVWSVNPKTGAPQVDRPDYFIKHPLTGEPIDFEEYYLDFVTNYARSIQSVMPSAFIFVEPIPNEPAPIWRDEHHEQGIVYAPHWYDLHSVFNKAFDGRVTHDVQGLSKGKNVFAATYFGLKGARKNYKGQIANILNTGLQNVGNKPCFIGECGIPMDINRRQAFINGDYGNHTKFLDAVLSAMEANLLSFALWNYNATNDNQYGDHWNGEDFSIFSLDSPVPSPDGSRSGTPGPDSQAPQRPTLRQQAPSFAKEVIKRAAANSADISDRMQIDRSKNTSSKAGSTSERGSSERTLSIESTGGDQDTLGGDDMMMAKDELDCTDDSPFDRSYQHFEDIETDEESLGHEVHIGGRALDAVIRPYAAKVAGEPILTEFNIKTLEYTFRFCNYLQEPGPVVHIFNPEQSAREAASAATSPTSEFRESSSSILPVATSVIGHPPPGTPIAFETEIFVPAYHYGQRKIEVLVSDGDWRYVRERQTLYYRHKDTTPGAVHSLKIRVEGQPTKNGGGVKQPQQQQQHYTLTTTTAAVAGLSGDPTADEKSPGQSRAVKAESEAGCLCTIM